MLVNLEPNFTLSAQARGNTLVIQLRGPFDLSGVGMVENAVDVALDSSLAHIVFDLSDVTFLDMAGLGALLRANHRARHISKDVSVVPPRGLAKRVFTLTRVGDHLTMIKEPNER